MPEFNLTSDLEHSRKVNVSDLDFSEASRYPLSPREIRCLTYMRDIEMTRPSPSCLASNGLTG